VWNFLINQISQHREAIFFDKDNRITYSILMNIVKQKGDILKGRLKPKSKCAILCNSNFKSAVAILACWYSDLIPIPMSKHYGESHCNNIILLTCPDLLITDDITLKSEYDIFGFNIDNNEFYGEYHKNPCEFILEDIAIIMCTSGTTGNPKGVMITEKSLIENVVNISKYFKITCNDTILIARPLYHCAVLTGEFLISLFYGVNICFFDDIYNPLAIIKSINENCITVLCGTPTLINHIATFYKRNKETSNMRTIAISGECLSELVAKNIRGIFVNTNIYNVYGLTEAAPRVSYLFPELFDEYSESVGAPLNGIIIKIVNDNFQELPQNEIGNIIVDSPSVMKGYYRNTGLTESTVKNGWLKTGDLGYINEKGLLYIISRADDMIIKAGMNIYPKEIETKLKTNKSIYDVVAYRIKTHNGQGIALDVVLSAESKTLAKRELMNICAGVLPSYQFPDEINIVDNLQKNASGKVIRHNR